MISTRLTTTDRRIQSCQFIPEAVRGLVQRRTADNKKFGKLEICVPSFNRLGEDEKEPPQNVIAGFVLDNSGSMEGLKLQHAVNTIRKFVEVIHAERNGKTIETQPFHAWIYLITFNSKAQVVIPYQEITEETIPTINQLLNQIRADGYTNYEAAFEKQTEVLEQIIKKITASTTILRFFETDGEITQGTPNIEKLYKMMRSTTTESSELAAESSADDDNSEDEMRRCPPHRIQFQDYIMGYGRDVDLGCLKALASPFPPPAPPRNDDGAATTATPVAAAAAAAAASPPSSLVTILKPDEIGWRVGEILSKFIMRYGIRFEVSVSTASPNQGTIELFEYNTHEWGSSTMIQSMMYGENRTLWVQYTPLLNAAAAAAASADIQVKIHYENPKTGEEITYTFNHNIDIAPTTLPDETSSAAALAQQQQQQPVVVDESSTSTILFQRVISLILGMIQIEILKQYREVEADRYDMDMIVREAYKTMRMLYSIDGIARLSFPNIACQTANLMNDVKVIIGLTTIDNIKEQHLVIHARRICSIEQELFNSGASVCRKYVDFEEQFEDEATRIIEAAAAAKASGNPKGDHPEEEETDEREEEELADDVFTSRIPTNVCYRAQHQQGRRHHQRFNNARGRRGGSELRTLCAKIAMARNNNQDVTSEEIYKKMRKTQYEYNQDFEDDVIPLHQRDDTFSSTPMNDDDVYTQRRMLMMRQMSAP
jgi:uncharacterized protein YegL